MQCSCRRAHHDGADFEWNLVRKRKRIRAGNFDEFRVTAVTMFADHLAAATELFQAAHTELTSSAAHQIMHANTVAHCDVRHIRADFLHAARDFVAKCHRQMIDPRNAGAIMRIGVTNSSSRNLNQNVARTDLRNWNVCVLKRFSELHKPNGFHCQRLNLSGTLERRKKIQNKFLLSCFP